MANLNDIAGNGSANSLAPEAPKESKEFKEPKKESKQTVTEMESEIKALELQAKKLELLERQANLQDLQERLDERQLKRDNVRQKVIINGQTLKQLKANDVAVQARCNHKKGGNGAQGVVAGQGDDNQHAVLKHIFANGDMWVRCLRCGKTWKPQLREWHKSDAAFEEATRKYNAAKNFQTRNGTSGAVVFNFSDQGKFYREVTEASNLR